MNESDKVLFAVDAVKELVASRRAAKDRVLALDAEIRTVRATLREALRPTKAARKGTAPPRSHHRRGLPPKPEEKEES